MTDIVIVGSGATGAHFALTALRRGHRVTMLDVGFARPEPARPELSFRQLKDGLDDPVAYFLGRELERVVYPSPIAKHYGFPPSKSYVFERPSRFAVAARGFEPTLSFARGGLAEAWTGGCYEFSADDLRDFPVDPAELEPCYAEVARRIGVSAAHDDIARFSPYTAPYLEPLPLDAHSARILARYDSARGALNRDLGFYLGRSRVATLSRDLGDRGACTGLGRCLWGCPRQSLWSPSLTIAECHRFEGFSYVPDHFVTHVQYDARGRVGSVSAVSLADGVTADVPGELVVLAAGTVATSGIYLASLLRHEGRRVALGGFMDNPHAVIPFLNTRHLGTPLDTETYQFHLLALAIAGPGGAHDAHGQITTLRAASVHPIVQSLPFDLGSGLAIFRRLRSALGVANVWRAGRRDPRNTISLESGASGDTLAIECHADSGEDAALDRTIGVVREALGRLDCLAPRRQVQVLPLGSSVHYAGTLPMSRDDIEHTTRPDGRVRGFENLLVADGAGFPSLPAKNLTFTLMANAIRIAELLP